MGPAMGLRPLLLYPMKTSCFLYRCGVALTLFACQGRAAVADITFSDMSATSGITFQHNDGSKGEYHIVETMCAGLALFDYDNDGDVDIYFLNGNGDGPGAATVPARNRLYRNNGNWRFLDVTEQAGVGDTGHGLGVAVGDYDNDGDQDLYVNNYGPNLLYQNQGDGTFKDVTQSAGVANGNRVGAGASFLDADGDGDLDLFVANYIKFSPDKHVPRTKSGYPIYGGPSDYTPETATYFQNNGDGTFTDRSREVGVTRHAAPGMGIISADYDRDGDTDVFVANDGQMNFLFENDGQGNFKEVGLLRGFAYDSAGRVHASMGVDCADFDNDGFLDFHVTSFQQELATLYRNIGGQLLEDVTRQSGAGIGTRAPVTWGTGFADFDNDGDKDLFVACGHLYDQIDKFDRTSTYETPNVLFENIGKGRFKNISATAGQGMQIQRCSRGAAFDDLDGDGDVDVVVLNLRGKPTLLRNDSDNNNRWLAIDLRGTSSNRDGVGAMVEIKAGGKPQIAEVHSGRGYQGHHGSRIHFGVGENKTVESVRISWIGGASQLLQGVETNQVIQVEEASPDPKTNRVQGRSRP